MWKPEKQGWWELRVWRSRQREARASEEWPVFLFVDGCAVGAENPGPSRGLEDTGAGCSDGSSL